MIPNNFISRINDVMMRKNFFSKGRNKSTNFVLLRHEITLKGETEPRSFYSLYMDIENPENNDTEIIPWLSKLKDYTLGSRISFEYKTLGITDHWEVFSDDRKENNNFQGAAA